MGHAGFWQGAARGRRRRHAHEFRHGRGHQATLRGRRPEGGRGGASPDGMGPDRRALAFPPRRAGHDLLAAARPPGSPARVAIAPGRRAGPLARPAAVARALRRLGAPRTRLEPSPRPRRPRGRRLARAVGRPPATLLPPTLPAWGGAGTARPVSPPARRGLRDLARAACLRPLRRPDHRLPRRPALAGHEPRALGAVRRVGARRRHRDSADARGPRPGGRPVRPAGLLQIRLPDRSPPQARPYPERKRPLVDPGYRFRLGPGVGRRAHRGLPRREHPSGERLGGSDQRNPRRGLRDDVDRQSPRGEHRPRPAEPRDRGGTEPGRVLALPLARVLRDERVQPGRHDRAGRGDARAAGGAGLRPLAQRQDPRRLRRHRRAADRRLELRPSRSARRPDGRRTDGPAPAGRLGEADLGRRPGHAGQIPPEAGDRPRVRPPRICPG